MVRRGVAMQPGVRRGWSGRPTVVLLFAALAVAFCSGGNDVADLPHHLTIEVLAFHPEITEVRSPVRVVVTDCTEVDPEGGVWDSTGAPGREPLAGFEEAPLPDYGWPR